MIFQWIDIGLDLELLENKINVLVMESQEVYADFMEKIIRSLEGQEGIFVLYENEKKLNFGKNVEMIFSPLLLDLNSKRIQSYLFDELKEVSDEYAYEAKERMNAVIVNYLDELAQKVSYPLKFRLELDEKQLFKQYEVGIEYNEYNLLEKTMNYIQIQSSLCARKVLFFANAKSYFTGEQLQELYKCAFYNKMHLIMVESFKNTVLQEEKYCIIDTDKCLIQHG